MTEICLVRDQTSTLAGTRVGKKTLFSDTEHGLPLLIPSALVRRCPQCSGKDSEELESVFAEIVPLRNFRERMIIICSSRGLNLATHGL